MPALMKSRVGSLAGTRDDEWTRLCPLLSKKRRKVSRISEPVGMHLHFTLLLLLPKPLENLGNWLHRGCSCSGLVEFLSLRSKPLESVLSAASMKAPVAAGSAR